MPVFRETYPIGQAAAVRVDDAVMVLVAVVCSAFLAGLLLPPSGALFGDPGVLEVLTSAEGGGAGLAVIVAAVIAVLVRSSTLLAALSISAAAVAGVLALLDSAAPMSVVVGGVLLGCAAVQAHSRRSQAALVASFLSGLLATSPIEALQYGDVPRRYADYLSESQFGPPVVVPALAVLVIVAALWSLRTRADVGPPQGRDRRSIAAALAVPVCGLVLHIAFVHSVFGGSVFGGDFGGRWYFGVLAVPVLFAVAALLPGRGGMPVLAGTAMIVTSSTVAGVAVEVGVDRLWTFALVLIVVVTVGAGAALGVRLRRPGIGIVVLALVCLSALFDLTPADSVAFFAGLVLFPAAAAYTFVACTPTDPLPLTIGLMVPVAVTVPLITSYGWTAYTPLTSADSSTFSPDAELWLSTGVSVAAVLLTGVGMALLQRRTDH